MAGVHACACACHGTGGTARHYYERALIVIARNLHAQPAWPLQPAARQSYTQLLDYLEDVTNGARLADLPDAAKSSFLSGASAWVPGKPCWSLLSAGVPAGSLTWLRTDAQTPLACMQRQTAARLRTRTQDWPSGTGGPAYE